jgi:hypothetical protein
MCSVNESESNKRRSAIQLAVNDEPDCYFVRDCFPSLVATVDSNDCCSEAVGQLENMAKPYMDGMFVLGTTQKASAISQKIERVFTEQNIDEARPRVLQQEPNNNGTSFNSRIYLDSDGDIEHALPDGVETIASILYQHCQVKELVECLTAHLFLTQFVVKGCAPADLETNTRVFRTWIQNLEAECEEEDQEERRLNTENVSEEESDDNTGESVSISGV